MAPLQKFQVRPNLNQVLKVAGATGELFTANQVISYIGKYIEEKKLYDPRNVRVVNCKGDLLEEAFGVERFEVGDFKDIWRFVFPCLFPATNKEVESHEKCSTDEVAVQDNSQNIETLEKDKNKKLDHWWMSHLPWWFFIDKKKNEEDPDNATGSVLETSTAYVADTDYGSSRKSNISIDRFSTEFEPDSDESEGYGEETDDTEPAFDSEEDLDTLVEIMSEADSGTTDTTDVSMDFPLEDHWQCGECTAMNPPNIGYCQRCWKMRKNWLPRNIDGPCLSRSLTTPISTQTNSQHVTESESKNSFDIVPMQRSFSQPVRIPGIDVADGRIRTKSCDETKNKEESRKRTFIDANSCLKEEIRTLKNENSNDISPSNHEKNDENVILDETDEPPVKKKSSVPCDLIKPYIPPNLNTETNSFEVLTPASSTSSEVSSEAKVSNTQPGLCNICHNNPNDATILHGKIGHQFCCYKCAQKLRKRGKPCPVCRQRIMLVIRNYIYQM